MIAPLFILTACAASATLADGYLILQKPGQRPFVAADHWGSAASYNCRFTADAMNVAVRKGGWSGYYYCTDRIPHNAQNKRGN